MNESLESPHESQPHREPIPEPLPDSQPDSLGIIPHCDQMVLHAPGICMYCDTKPLWQELRKLWGIAFTGNLPLENEMPCPSDRLRGIGGANVWGGNRPVPEKKEGE